MSRGSCGAWASTTVATVVSTYALDAVAAGAGALLVASHLLAALDRAGTLAVLIVSYVAWAAALRPALGANWTLLERTGTSTCLPSKVAHSLALRRGLGPQSRRMAAGVGYVGTELAKEGPYYLGAVGAALLTEAVSTTDAVIFLAGANFGAAAYELGLARLVRVVLSRLAPARYASFEEDWTPAAYLADYYAAVEPDERLTIAFLTQTARDLPPSPSVLVFGVGPTLHHVFPFVPKAHIIDLCDVLPANLAEVRRWLAADPNAHDWQPFVRHVLAREGEPVTPDTVARREALTRARVGRLLVSDLRHTSPMPGESLPYDVVVSAFCAESATADRVTWAAYMCRIASLVRPGGMLVIAALRQSRGYHVGGRLFPSANVDEGDLWHVLGPLTASLEVEACLLPEQEHHGYGGILLARGRMKAASASHPHPRLPGRRPRAKAA